MRRRRRRADFEIFSLSFLDAICCGFGAIVLLLVLTKLGEPGAIEQAREDLDALIVRLELELAEIRGETAVLDRDLLVRRQQLSEERVLVARLRGDLSRLRGEYAATEELSEVDDIMSGRLLAAQQRLTEEMRRLQDQSSYDRPEDAPVGGIPVDSEYVIFIIDTSGSMKNHAWPLVLKKMTQVLDAYPQVKGLQVMNDMGQYLFSQYRGKWIPDTPGRRKVVLERLRNWNVFSNSSPVEGITAAIRTFANGGEMISVYVFGDEFSGGSIDEVVKTVDRINRVMENGERQVRIHALGFPTVFKVIGAGEQTGVQFATLMRIICRKNGGAFVGLNSLN
ncbi:MAG: VWA domain-containing protein [Acidobacteria bacterium]|nr:MAG: VWA domain-containing protein [Acidobacteriota bacterium]